MNRVGIPYKRAALDECWDVIVIGSGMGGLTAAALLSLHASKRVLVLERHYTAGGFTHSFRRPGFDWDVGLHYIGNVLDPSNKVRAAFDHLTQGALQWQPMPEVYDEIRIGGERFSFVAGRERFREEMKRSFPASASEIDAYLRAITAADDSSYLFFTEKGIPHIASRLAGDLLRRSFLRWASRTTADVLSDITSDPLLTAVLTAQWGDYGLPPGRSSFGVHAITAMHFLDGGAFPVGGGAQIATTIAPAIERNGGAIVVNAEVSEIVLDRSGRARGVRLADGRELRSNCIISNAGARNTFSRLVSPDAKSARLFASELESIPPSTAYLNLYVGLDDSASNLGLSGGNIWVHPTASHDRNCERFEQDPDAPFPMLFISFPSAKDPQFHERNGAHATIDVLTFVPYEWFAKWEGTRWGHRSDGYDRLKQQFANRLVGELERHVPAVRGHIVHAELGTPLSTRHFSNYATGEAYGLGAVPQRFLLRGLRAQTPVPNLYLTGHDVVMVGVVGAMFGGVLAASSVLKRNLVPKVTRPFNGTRAVA